MTPTEFSTEFDILYNNLASNAAPPLNEYEKSVFLTKAQLDIVVELYSGRNQLGLYFESSEEVRTYLKPLFCKDECDVDVETGDITYPADYNVWFITREEYGNIPVVSVSQDEYNTIKNNPFRRASDRRALKVSFGEIDSIDYPNRANDKKYIVYGIKKPTPIILPNIGDPTLSIDEVTTTKELNSELDSYLHKAILDRAVTYAKQTYIGGSPQE